MPNYVNYDLSERAGTAKNAKFPTWAILVVLLSCIDDNNNDNNNNDDADNDDNDTNDNDDNNDDDNNDMHFGNDVMTMMTITLFGT